MSSQLQKNYDALKRLQETTVAAVEIQQADIKKLQSETAFYKTQLVNANANVFIQKKIVVDHINQSQEKETGLVKEILLLKAIIKRLGGS